MIDSLTVDSSLDCTSGYHHITLSPEAQKKSAFITQLKFKKVPFGLVLTPEYFLQLIIEVLKIFLFAFGYLYDIHIFSKNIEEHLRNLTSVFSS